MKDIDLAALEVDSQEQYDDAQEEAHEHFVAGDFSFMVEQKGVVYALSRLDDKARNMIISYSQITAQPDIESDFNPDRINAAIRKLNELHGG